MIKMPLKIKMMNLKNPKRTMLKNPRMMNKIQIRKIKSLMRRIKNLMRKTINMCQKIPKLKTLKKIQLPKLIKKKWRMLIKSSQKNWV